MLHGSFSTDGLLIGQGGESFDLPCIIFVDVDSRQAESAVHLSAKEHGQNHPSMPDGSFLVPLTFAYPDWTNMFEELCHLLHLGLLSQPCDVYCAVLRVILLFRTSCKYIKTANMASNPVFSKSL